MRQLNPVKKIPAYTLSLNSISALYPVFSQFMATTPPNSMVKVPIKIPGEHKTKK